jgi:hypothetical protein
LELLRTKASKDPAEGVVGRDPVRQFEKSFKPVMLGLAKGLHRHPVIGTADHAADGHGEDVHQEVAAVDRCPGFLDVAEVVREGSNGVVVHGQSPLVQKPSRAWQAEEDMFRLNC